MKMKLLAVVLIFVAAGAATATDVINVAIRGYNDNRPYIGSGAYGGSISTNDAYDVCNSNVWIPYSGGWGLPVGSARSEALVPATVPTNCQSIPSVYAAQVWIGDNGQHHYYIWGSDTNLMDSGFVAEPCSPTKEATEPNISIWGQDAYQGTYDIYVYGDAAGTFSLTQYGVDVCDQSVTGGVAAGQFVLGGNYVIFPNVDINNSNSADLYLSYSNHLNGLQFVSKKTSFAIEPNALGLIQIPAGYWNVAGRRNTRTDSGSNHFGPNTYADGNVIEGVGYLSLGDFMLYDITVDDANAGLYSISLSVTSSVSSDSGPLNYANIFLDGRYLGDVADTNKPPRGWEPTTAVTANLYKGNHTVAWLMAGLPGVPTGGNIGQVNFVRIGNTVLNNCGDVVNYGFTLASDLSGDCYVNLGDLALFADSWLICNNPDPNGCF